METRFARFVTYIFHPLLVPLYSLNIIFQLNIFHVYIIPINIRWLIMGMMVIATIALPVVVLMMMLRKGLISSFRLEQRRERLYPYVIMVVIYYAMYLLLSSVHIPSIIINMLLGITILVALALIINIWWKISIHMVGMGGLTGLLIGIANRYLIDIRILIYLTIVFAGIVGYARLKLSAHKTSEVYGGFLIGIALMLMVYLIF